MEETILEYAFGNMPFAISEATSLSSDKHIEHPIVLSLFSGAGGLDIGFHQVGFKIVACVEIEKVFSETLRINADKHIDIDCQVINRDIRDEMWYCSP